MTPISAEEAELASLRAEFLGLMSSIADTPAEARANAGRMEEIRKRIAEISSGGADRRVAEMRGVPTESSIREEMESIAGEIAEIGARIREAEASSDFELISRLAMSASALERRRRTLGDELESLRSDRPED